MQIRLVSEDVQRHAELEALAQRWGLEHDDNAIFALVLTAHQLELRKCDEPKLGAIFVDFTAGAVAHRRKFGGGRGQAIAKAVGLKQGKTPKVLDATAGLGRDAFVLASLGCEVAMIERHPVVAALLDDGLKRAYADADIGQWMQSRMTLLHASSQVALTELGHTDDFEPPQVIYLDPMYPHKKKSALVKKEMRVFQSLVGSDDDADDLLTPALALATERVVVKRPDYAEDLNGMKPNMAIETKKNRFDVYVKAAGKAGEK